MIEEVRWKNEIDRAVKTASRKWASVEKDDLYQEAALAIVQAGDTLRNSEQAFKLASAACSDFVRKTDLQESSLNDPVVDAEASLCSSYEDPAKLLDNAAVRQAVDRLPDPEYFVISSLFGIGCDPMSERELAKVMLKTAYWVSQKKKSGLSRLREMMKNVQ